VSDAADWVDLRWRALASRHVADDTAVVEVAPGFSDRIGRALRDIGFAGRLHVVEPNRHALRHTLERYAKLLPHARIVPHARCLADACDALACGRTVMLMNHAFDDMLLAAAVPRDLSERIFSRMRPGSAVDPFVHALWGILADAGPSAWSIADRVVDGLMRTLVRAAPRVVIASHYTSWYHRSPATRAGDHLGARVRDRLRDVLEADRRFRMYARLNGDDWIVALRA
jgi:hypothetical protein